MAHFVEDDVVYYDTENNELYYNCPEPGNHRIVQDEDQTSKSHIEVIGEDELQKYNNVPSEIHENDDQASETHSYIEVISVDEKQQYYNVPSDVCQNDA